MSSAGGEAREAPRDVMRFLKSRNLFLFAFDHFRRLIRPATSGFKSKQRRTLGLYRDRINLPEK